jgi:hypothetical protein
MSILLFFYDPDAPETPAGAPPNVDKYVRRVDSWELSYALGSTAIFRCKLVDKRTDKENAFRPPNDWRVEVRQSFYQPLFRGRIVRVVDAPLGQPNVGVAYNIDCIGESEVFESRHFTGTFGGDPVPVEVSYFTVASPVQIKTQDAHGLTAGDEITLEGIKHPQNGSFSPVNGEKVVLSVIDPYNYTVDGTQPLGHAYGGSSRKKVRLRTILQALEDPYLTDYGFSLAPDILLGPLLEVQKFDNAPINDVYRHLSKVTGWIHRYLPNRVVEWFEPSTKLSVLSFTKDNVLGNTEWTQARVKKANTVILKYGQNQQVSVTETIIGDGVTREWPLTHKPIVTRPISSTSTRLALSVPEGDGGAYVWRHVGVHGYDTLFEFVYRESDNTLVQLAVAAGVAQPVKPVGWVGVANITEQLPASVREVDPLIGTDPIREKLVAAPGIIDRNAARQVALAELNGLTTTPKEAKIVTEAGLTWPGNSANVDLPHILATGEFLLISFSAVQTEAALRYTYSAIEGNKFTATWQERIRGLFGGGTGNGGSSVISGSIASSSGGGGGGTMLGTANKIPVFTSQTTLGDSVLEQSTDGTVVSTVAAVEASRFQSPAFRGITAGAIDGAFENAAGQAVFDVPTTTRNARFYGDVITEVVTSESDLTLGAVSNSIYPTGNALMHFGGPTRRWLTAHIVELAVEQLVAQETISTIAGSLIFSPTSVLEADLPVAATSIIVRHNEFAVNDRVMMKNFGQFEVMIITGGPTGTGPYTYTVTRNHDGSGANDWFAGNAVVNTGVVGDGFIDAYSRRGTKSALEVGPTIVGNVRTALGAMDWETRWALGNLRGLYNYGAVNIYGFAAGQRTGAWVAVDATNGYRVMWNNTVFTQINAGVASFTGTVNITGGNGLTTGTAAADVNANATTISGGKITANSVTASQIAAGTITATQIAGGTITGDKIAAGTITADKLSVGTLSAITANIGNVTAGSISGTTITAGDVTLNSSGISIAAGTGTNQQVKWANGANLYGNGAYLGLWGPTYIALDTPGGSVGLTNGSFWPATQISLGQSGARWGNLYTVGADIDGSIHWGGQDFQGAGIGRVMVVAGDGVVHAVDNGVSGSFSSGTFTFENGVLTNHS